MKKLLLFFFFLPFLSHSFSWKGFSLKNTSKIKLVEKWRQDTVKEGELRTHSYKSTPPVLTETLVITPALNEVKAFQRKNGKKAWGFLVPGGVASQVSLFKEGIYFSGQDGFFYKLRATTGQLEWKHWVGSSTSPAFVDEGGVYFLSLENEIKALNAKGELRWTYKAQAPLLEEFVFLSSAPVSKKNILFFSLKDQVLALNKSTGTLRWKKTFKGRIELSYLSPCLVVSVRNSESLCLREETGEIKTRSKNKWQSVFIKDQDYYYQLGDELYKVRNGEKDFIFKKSLPKKEDIKLSFLKDLLIYAFPTSPDLFFANKKTGDLLFSKRIGRGLSSPVTADESLGEIYFLSLQGYLYKMIIPFPQGL